MNRKKTLTNNLYKLTLLYLLSIGVFALIRIFFFVYFSDLTEVQELKNNLFLVLTNSIRFDTVVSLFGFVVIYLLILLFLIVPKNFIPKYQRFFSIFFRFYALITLLIFVIIATLDFYFYINYKTHFDALIFALKNDSTTAILKSIWSDYPVLFILLFWLSIGFLLNIVLKKINSINSAYFFKYHLLFYCFLVLFSGVYFIGLRGSLGMFPLQLKHAYVTDNQFLNKMITNGVFALKSVLAEGDNKERINADYTKTLKQYGFTDIEQALRIFNEDTISENPFFKTTKKNTFLEESPPNIVFILVESFGTHFMDLHTAERNTLGSLKDVLDDCFVFKNILSSSNLTINTFENILVGTTFSSIAQTPYKSIPLASSITIPFNKANYTTNFLYSGEYGWRNIGDYSKTQGFNTIITQKNLEEAYPHATTNPWGVHDEYLYDKIFSILKKEKTPQFIFALTTSNHSPYELPEHYKLKPLKINDSILDKMLTDEDLTYKIFTSFQYTADQLGLLIKRIKESELGENTIIAVTGDHSSHKSFDYSINEHFYKRSVPFLLYVPKKYQKNIPENLSVFGSHKDIFPTLYHLSLSYKEYFNTGENLFSSEKSFALNAFNFAADESGAVMKGKPSKYFKWEKNSILLQVDTKNPKLDSLKQKMKAYNSIMDYYIKHEFYNNHKSKQLIH